MMEQNDASTEAKIAHLQGKLAACEAQIAEKQAELENATSTFRTVLALKNRKIKDLEEEIRRLNIQKEEGSGKIVDNVVVASEQVQETTADNEVTSEETEQPVVQNVEEYPEKPNAKPSEPANPFAGEWLNISSNNVEAYLKEIGYGMLARNIAARMRPFLIFEITGDHWTMLLNSSVKTQVTKFRLGEEFEEESPSGGKVSSKYTLDGNRLFQDSRAPNGELSYRIERTVDGNILTIIAELRRQLALRGAEIAEIREELKKATTTFRSDIALKNRNITEFKEEIGHLRKERDDSLKRKEDRAQTQAMATEVKELRAMVQRMEVSQGKLGTLCDGVSLNQGITTLRARFTNISQLTTAHNYSRSIRVAGMDWAISTCTFTEGPVKYLSAHLIMSSNRRIPKDWSCSVSSTTKLYRYGVDEKPHVTEFEQLLYTADDRGWGSRYFLPFEDLMNPANNFVKDDAIRMEVSFKVFSTV